MTQYFSQESIEGFAIIGILVCIGMAVIGLSGVIMRLREIAVYKWKQYKDKHFTENPPKPKCYCIQCEYWETSDINREGAPCRIWDKWTCKDETCCRGMLRTERGYKDEKWRIEKQKENNQ